VLADLTFPFLLPVALASTPTVIKAVEAWCEENKVTPEALFAKFFTSEPITPEAVEAQQKAEEETKELWSLLEEKKFGDAGKVVAKNPLAVFKLIKDAGIAGVISFAIVYSTFYTLAGGVAEVTYHTTTGNWLEPQMFFQEDAPGKAEALAFLGAFFVGCQPFKPFRLLATIFLIPTVRKVIDKPEPTDKLETSK